MADLTVTAANVSLQDGKIGHGTAGATITAGRALYRDAADGNKLKLANADTAGTATVAGIALNSASSGQPVAYVTGGIYNAGATVAVGTVYVLSDAAAGGIAPVSDFATGSDGSTVSVIGVGVTSGRIDVSIHNSGAVIPA